MTCGAPECKSKAFSGADNPFWGKVHDPEMRSRLSQIAKTRKRGKKTGPPKGYKHSPEARAKITTALKARWASNRNGMLASLEKGAQKQRGAKRIHLYEFTPMQLREWKGTKCFWCNSTDELELDHILPISCGGRNIRNNAQTLCRKCNVWKMAYVDRPLILAGATYSGATVDNPSNTLRCHSPETKVPEE